jgi:integrative and conjugative element protein (TIGR02256 family)
MSGIIRTDSHFATSGGKFHLHLTGAALTRMIQVCRESKGNEVGGILVGFYTEDHTTAIVTNVSTPSDDSKAGRTWYLRGVRRLRSWLRLLWQQNVRQYYLGEWHSHPGGSPVPSKQDIDQMIQIAVDENYQCREPILAIIGGGVRAKSKMKAYVFPQGRRYLEFMDEHLPGNCSPLT